LALFPRLAAEGVQLIRMVPVVPGEQRFLMTDTIRRQTYQNKRVIRRALSARSVREAVGPITPGIEVFGVSRGQFSLIDLVTHCLEATGPADVVMSTWTAAGADLGFAYQLMRDGRIRSLRFLVDFSFPSRQPAYCAALRETFGDDCVRVTKNHAKFVLITNDSWNLVIRTSMNLNENKRLESFEVSDDANMAAFLKDLVADIFDSQPAAGQFDKRPIDHVRDFENTDHGRYLPGPANPHHGADSDSLKSTDVRKFYSDDPFGNDLRRAGLSYIKG
jgi:hypothetical protein